MLKKIQLKNFKCFDELSLPLGPLTLLSGFNGMGKSSLIQALLVLRQSYLQGLLERHILSLNGDLIKLGAAKDVLCEHGDGETLGIHLEWNTDYEDKLKEKAKELSFSEQLPFEITGDWNYFYDSFQKMLRHEKPKPELFNGFDEQKHKRIKIQVDHPDSIHKAGAFFSLFNDNFHYLQAERLGSRSSFESSGPLVSRHCQLDTHGELATDFLKVFGEKEVLPGLCYPNASDASSHTLRRQVEVWMNEITPGARIQVESREGMDVVNLRYSFAREMQTANYHRSIHVDFGNAYTLSIFVAILSASPGALILVENPETHLHPRGQTIMGTLMAQAAAAGIQVIVETHSDHVLNGIRIAVRDGRLKPRQTCFHYFTRDNTGEIQISTPVIDNEGRIDHWPEGFFDESVRSLAALSSRRRRERRNKTEQGT